TPEERVEVELGREKVVRVEVPLPEGERARQDRDFVGIVDGRQPVAQAVEPQGQGDHARQCQAGREAVPAVARRGAHSGTPMSVATISPAISVLSGAGLVAATGALPRRMAPSRRNSSAWKNRVTAR